MASFIKIGSIWIDFSQYDLTDPHQCEPSTIRDNENEDNAQVVRRTDKENILENICNNQISSVPSQNISPGLKETTCHPDVMSIKKTNLAGGIVTCEPEEIEMESINNVSIINNDDKASIADKGKGDMIQTNEELESSSSLEEEILEVASHFLLFPHDALQFGEGASKSFEDGTDSRLVLNIDEGIDENLLDEFYSPPNNVQENNVSTKENECESNIDEMAMHEVTEICKDKLPNMENSNGLRCHSILVEETHAVSEEEVKFEKQSSRSSRPQEKMDPKRRKYEKN